MEANWPGICGCDGGRAVYNKLGLCGCSEIRNSKHSYLRLWKADASGANLPSMAQLPLFGTSCSEIAAHLSRNVKNY